MVDFGAKVKAAEKEARTEAKSPQSRKKRTVPKSAWKKGESGNPETQFKPGVSGNPGGKPQKTPITDAMRDLLRQPYEGKDKRFAGKTNAEVLALRQFELAIEENDLPAQKEIADRVEGKVSQTLKVGGDGSGVPIEIATMTPEQKRQRVAEIMAKARGTD